MRILWIEIWPGTLPYVSRKSQKTEFRENQKRQKCVFGHFLTSDVTFILDFFCLILNSTYRTNETFFSRTLSFGSPFQTLVGGWLIKVLKMDKTMLRMKTLVWYPDGPRGVVGAHSVQCCVRIWTPACSQQSIFFCFGLVGVVFVYVVFKEFGSCGFSILFMYNILKLVYVMFMFSNGILWQLIGQNEKHIIFTDPPTHRWKAPP